MKHVVVGIISRKNENDETEYLLVSSRKNFGEFTHAYYPPGGHVETDEDEKVALVREVEEELGVKAEVGEKIAETLGDVKDQITYWYKCEIVTSQFTIDSAELNDVGWFTQEQMIALRLWPATKLFFDNYIFNV